MQELGSQPWESESNTQFGTLSGLVRSQTCTDDASIDDKSATMTVTKSWEGEAVVGDKSQWYGSSYDVSYNPSQHVWIPQAGWERVQTPSERNVKRDNSWTHRELNKTLRQARQAASRQAAPPPNFHKPGRNSQEALSKVAPGPKVLVANEMAAVQAQPDEFLAKQDVIAVQQPVREEVEVTGESAESGNIVSVMKERNMAAETSNNVVISATTVNPRTVPLTKEATNTQIPSHAGGYPSEHTAALLQTFNDDTSFAVSNSTSKKLLRQASPQCPTKFHLLHHHNPRALSKIRSCHCCLYSANLFCPPQSAAHNTASITMDTVKSEVDGDTRAKRLLVDASRPSTLNIRATSSPPSQTRMTTLPRPASHSEAPEEYSSVEVATKLGQPKCTAASKSSHSQPTKSRSSIQIPGFDPDKYGSPTARKPKLEDPHRDLGETSLSASHLNNESSAAASSAMQDTTGTSSRLKRGYWSRPLSK